MDRLLALFPLNTVLFPGGTLPLHIFEERYKRMIGRCITLKEPFGVALIREGPEVGGSAEPHKVGTTAVITGAVRLSDGRMLIAAEGRARFRIQQTVQSEPYRIACVELLADAVGDEQRAQAEQLYALYERYRAGVARATNGGQTLADLPRDPISMSYQLSAQIQVPDYSKQQLLEAPLETRLEALIAALDDELRYLPPLTGKGPASSGHSWSLN